MVFSVEGAKAKNAVGEKTGICCIIVAAAIFGMMPICAKLIYSAGGNSWFLSLDLH